MKREEIISAIEELLTNESLKGLGKEFSSLSKEFNTIKRLEEEKQKQQQQVLEGEEEIEVATISEEDKKENLLNVELNNKIETLIGEFKNRQNSERELEEEEWKKNLTLKKSLIDRLDEVIGEEERIGPAINKFVEIQKEWNSVGNVASDKFQDIQKRYSKAVELFNYNIGIYKELQSNDLKKNQKVKEDLIQEVKDLLGQENIKEVDKLLKKIQQKWDEAGPIEQKEWETLKATYWENVKLVQKKIQDFYDQLKADYNDNLKLKIELIEKAHNVMLNKVTTNHKEWEAVTKEMLEIQEEWNKVGPTKRENNEQARKLFRSYYDTLFAEKQEFYTDLKAKNAKLKEKKVALIEKAKALESSTDWKQTAEDLIQLQKQWKNVGTVSRGEEQKLWETFRASCNAFFDAKQAHFDEMDKANAGNLKLKLAVIAKIEAFKIEADIEKSIQDLKNLSVEFNAIGHVPFKEKEAIYTSYKKALEAHYDGLKLNEADKERLLFENRLEILKQSNDPARAFEKEKIHIRNKISSLNDEIIQSENNLGFFSGKGAEKLKEQVAQNVSKVQEEIDGLKIRLKLIPND